MTKIEAQILACEFLACDLLRPTESVGVRWEGESGAGDGGEETWVCRIFDSRLRHLEGCNGSMYRARTWQAGRQLLDMRRARYGHPTPPPTHTIQG